MQPLDKKTILDFITTSIRSSIDTKEKLLAQCTDNIATAGERLVEVIKRGGKIMFCGNGGSAADSQHLAAELVGHLRHDRRPLPALALTTDTSALTAIGNDYEFKDIFSRQVRALGRPGDVLIGISTSGNSKNVLEAVLAAKDMNIVTIGLLGKGGGKIAPLCDYTVIAPGDDTQRAQECHLLVGHIWMEMIESSVIKG
jgi:D-sedoheptulose 7-phosphate isomerase